MAYSSVKQNRHTIAGEASAIMSKILNAPASCLIEIVSHVSSVAHDDRTILCLSTTMLLVRFSRFFLPHLWCFRWGCSRLEIRNEPSFGTCFLHVRTNDAIPTPDLTSNRGKSVVTHLTAITVLWKYNHDWCDGSSSIPFKNKHHLLGWWYFEYLDRMQYTRFCSFRIVHPRWDGSKCDDGLFVLFNRRFLKQHKKCSWYFC